MNKELCIGTMLAAMTLIACGGEMNETVEMSNDALSSNTDFRDRVEGLFFYSSGDPHEKTGDGLYFDNMRSGPFVAIISDSAYAKQATPWVFELQKLHQKSNGVAMNARIGLRLGTDIVSYGVANTPRVNGTLISMSEGQLLGLPGGGYIKRWPNSSYESLYTFVSPIGDFVTVYDYGRMLNLYGRVSSARGSERLRGSMGAFDADEDPNNDLLSRDGQKTYSLAQLDAFLDEWTAREILW